MMTTTTGVFIDGANVYMQLRERGLHMNWRKFKQDMVELSMNRDLPLDLQGFYYFTAIDPESREPGNRSHNITRLYDWLEFNGFTMMTKDADIRTREINGEETRVRKGNVDVEFALDTWRISTFMRTVFLFTGDGDFAHLARLLKERGQRVVVLGFSRGISERLRRAADNVIHVDERAGWATEITSTGNDETTNTNGE